MWDDSQVVLVGTIDKDKLHEAINGPPMIVEVHDRDLTLADQQHAVNSQPLFGEAGNAADVHFGTHALTEGRPNSSQTQIQICLATSLATTAGRLSCTSLSVSLSLVHPSLGLSFLKEKRLS